MVASGLPIQWANVGLIKKLDENISEMKSQTDEKLNQILQRVEDVPSRLSNFIAENYDGQAPASVNQMNYALRQNMEELRREIMQHIQIPARMNQQMNEMEQNSTNNHVNNQRYQTWNWSDGRMGMPLPQSYKLQGCFTINYWNLWFFGDNLQNIRPFRLIASKYFDMLKCKSYFLKGKKVVNHLLLCAVDLELLDNIDASIHLSEAQLMNIFERSFKHLMKKLAQKHEEKFPDVDAGSLWYNNPNRRIYELKYTYIYADIIKLM